jgi:hypothetical protein
MTASEIREKVSQQKPVSRPQLYRYIKALNITPIGARQKPQRFPDDAADRILIHLGFKNGTAKVTHSVAATPTGKTVLSLRTLKSERNKRGAR